MKKVNGNLYVVLEAGSVALSISNASVTDAWRFLQQFCNALQSLEKGQPVQVKEPLQYTPLIETKDEATG